MTSSRDATFDAWLREIDQRAVASVASTLDTEAALERVRRRAVAALPLPAAARLPADERALAWVGAVVAPTLRAPVVVDASAARSVSAMSATDAVAPAALRAAELRPDDGLVALPSLIIRAVARDAEVTNLLDAARAGKGGAIEALLAQVRPLVVRYCRARVGLQERSFASADDVAQEVCLAVLTALPSYRDHGRSFLAFVYGIAAHKVADAHRAAARNRSEPVAVVPDRIDDADPAGHAIRGELSGEMAELLNVLPAKQREIVILRVLIGLSAEETADAIGSTLGAVRVAQHRALVRLRAALPDW
jgi:RNA polymerase sigma-70 factor (ECF subfamily)